MTAFKVGDRVKIVSDEHGYGPEFKIGHPGTVSGVAGHGVDVKLDYCVYGSLFFYNEEISIVEAAQTSNKTPSLVHKTTPKNDDSGEQDSQPSISNNAWFERGELPPIGTICEHEPSGFSNEWFSVEVLAHKEFKGHDAGLLVVFATEDDVSFSSGECFRPIKTKEQLEEEAKAQERERAINKMEWDGGSDLSVAERLLLEKLYDAGYRKFE